MRAWIENGPPTVAALVFRPDARRRQFLLVVPRCPFCGGEHAHTSPDRTGGLRLAGCGRRYRLVVSA